METKPLKMKDKTLIPKCGIATDFMSRFWGLMGRTEMSAEEALLFPKCNSIHMFFMKISLDIVFLAKDGTVVEVIEGLPPWRMLLPRRKVAHTLEMATGLARKLGIVPGEKLDWGGGVN